MFTSYIYWQKLEIELDSGVFCSFTFLALKSIVEDRIKDLSVRQRNKRY